MKAKNENQSGIFEYRLSPTELLNFVFSWFLVLWFFCGIFLCSLSEDSINGKITSVLFSLSIFVFTFWLFKNRVFTIYVLPEQLRLRTLWTQAEIPLSAIVNIRSTFWQKYNLYVLTCRNGNEYKLPASFIQKSGPLQDLYRQFWRVSPQFLTARQNIHSLLFQGNLMFCSSAALLIALSIAVSSFWQLLQRHTLNSELASTLPICLLAGGFGFVMVAFRARNVSLNSQGVFVKAWIFTRIIPFQSIQQIFELAIVRAKIIKAGGWWYIVGYELTDVEMFFECVEEKMLLLKQI